VTFRRILFPLRLAVVRLARRGERVVLVALGIAAAAALLSAVLAGSLVAQDQSLARATAAVPPADRTVRLTWGGIASGGPNDPAAVDRFARSAVKPLAGRPIRAMLFRQSQAQGHLFDLGAIDGLGRFVHVRSGRLPAPCRPSRCEVLQLGGSGPIPQVDGLRLVRVGRATLDSALPLGDLITAETYKNVLSSALVYHTAPTPPLLLAEGVAGLAGTPALAPTYRSYAWTSPLGPHDVHPWTLDSFARLVQQTRSRVEAESLAYDLTAPVDELRAADENGRVSARRLLVIGGESAALLLAFAVLAASGLRRDAEAEWQRLTWYGGRRWQLALVSSAEVVAVAIAGAAIGWAVGAGVGAVVAGRANVAAGAILGHSVISGRGFVLAVAIALAAAAAVLLTLRTSAARFGALTVTPVDAAAAGAVVAIVVALARGAVDANALATESGTGALLLLLPALIAFVAAVVFARLLAPALALLERYGRAGPASLRLAALSLARNPGRAIVATAFVVVSLGLALFAETYHSTLVRGQRDHASFAVPADDILSENLLTLVPVLQAASPAQLERAVPGTRVLPAVRLSADVHRLSSTQSVTALGLPASALPSLRWRGDYAGDSPAKLARLLRPTGSVALQGIRLPDDARTLTLGVRRRGDALAVRAVVLTRFGTARGIPLGTTFGHVLRGRVPPDTRGGRLVSFIFDLTAQGLHGVPNGGANTLTPAVGSMRLGPLRVDGHGLALPYARWTGTEGMAVAGPGRLRYIVASGSNAQFRARQPTDGGPIPIVVTRSLASAAGPGGVLPVAIGDGTVVGRIVATARRIPTIAGDAVLADATTLTTALDADAPGAGSTNELWLDAPPGREGQLDAALRKPPFDVLQVRSYRRVLSAQESDPLARGTLYTLVGAAIVAVALALLGILLGVVSDIRDERGELFDLEAQGAEPGTLRRHLRLRAGLVAAAGLLGGIALGALLTGLIVALVTLTAGAGHPEPPLLLGADWSVLLLGLLGFVTVAAVLVAAATRRAFNADVAGRFAEVGT
jgi:FtsX-like permease family protein